MDVNGTRFHLLLGRDDWLGPGTSVEPADALEWHAPDHTVRLSEIPFRFPGRAGDRRLGPAHRRGAGRDRYGRTYWIGPRRDEVLSQAPGSSETARFWPQTQPCADPSSPPGAFAASGTTDVRADRFAGLAVTAHHHLVVGVPAMPGVLVFDLHAGGPPIPIRWPAPLTPVDMAPTHDGGVWILDGPAEPGHARCWALDRRFRICDLSDVAPPVRPASAFRPAEAETVDEPPARARTTGGGPLELRAEWAVAVEALPDGSVLVLDRGVAADPVLLRYDTGGLLQPVLSLPDLGGLPIDVAFVPDREAAGVAGTLFVAEDQGDQAFAFRLGADGTGITRTVRYLPMRLFSGKGLIAAGDEVFYDMSDRWLPLVDRRRPLHRTRATLDVGPFDSGEPGSTWHRLALDARIPTGLEVTVQSRAADDPDVLPNLDWADEPAPHLRGQDSEVPYHRFGDGRPDTGTWELLFQRAVGRYLQLRLTVRGDGRRTPQLWALRAYAPRFSYLDAYLPDVYQQDPGSASFLDRYLANVEGMFTALEGRVERAQVLFDAATADAEYLEWLGGWLGGVMDPAWDEARRRLFLEHAFTLFTRRGTVRGVLEAIRLSIDPCPGPSIFAGPDPSPFAVRIVEAFRTRAAPGVVHGDPTELAGPRLAPAGGGWTLVHGRSELDRRWRDFLHARHGSAAALERARGREVRTDSAGGVVDPFPPLTPSDPEEAADRADFVAEELSVTYAPVGRDDLAAYRRFLAQRYRRPEQLNQAWGLSAGSRIASFEEVGLPATSVPPDGSPLRDWIHFVGVHLPATRAAHRFAVFVPVRSGETDATRLERLRRVEQIVAHQRPGHAAFEVKPYWASCRVGEARVGYETHVGEGSRSVAIVLGESHLAQGHVRRRHPWNVPDRWVVGRERVRPGGMTHQGEDPSDG
jgi:phage tail-like protein